MVSADVQALLSAPEVQGMMEAAAHRATIADGVGILGGDDVMSELRLRALQAALAFDSERGFKFTTYLWPLLWGKAVDLRRRHGRQDRNGRSRPVAVPIFEEALDIAGPAPDELGLALMIGQLPLRERAAILLREIGGLPADEIGPTLGLSDGRAKALRRQAVRRLRVALDRRR